MLVLAIVSTVGLIKKIWRSYLHDGVKILLFIPVVLPLILCLAEARTMRYGYPFLSSNNLIYYSVAFIIALNWSIDIAKRLSKWNETLNPYVSIPFLTLGLTFLIPFSLFQLGIQIEKLMLG